MAKGNFIEYVISDDPNKYPNGSEQDGYYYRKVTKFETEEQTVTAGTTPIEVVPSQGKLISKVNINPTPTEEKTVIPTTEDLIVAPVEGKQLSQVTVQGDANFLEENIAEGITIWGKTGTHQGGGVPGQYVWSKQYAGSNYTYESKSSTYTLTNDSIESVDIEYSTTAPVYNIETKKWDMADSTIITLINTDNFIPNIIAQKVYIRMNSEPNIWYLYQEKEPGCPFSVGSASSNNTYIKTFTYSTKYTAAIDSSYIEYVTGETEADYPDGEWKDGFWYDAVTKYPKGGFWKRGNIVNVTAYSICFHDGVYLGACSKGIYKSTDGKTFEKVFSINNTVFYSIAYGNGVWVAVSNNYIYYSTDSINWNQGKDSSNNTLAFYCRNATSLCFADGLFVAANINSASSTYGIYYSNNGVNWTKANSIKASNIVKINGYWFAYGDLVTSLYYSTDGQSWSQASSVSGYVYDIASSDDMIVIAGSGGLYYSTDGINWTRSDSQEFNAVCYGNGMWVAGSNNSKRLGLRYSSDGITWISSNITTGYFHTYDGPSVRFLNNMFIACSYNYQGVYYSLDGINWLLSNLYNNAKAYNVQYINGLFYICNGSGLFYSDSEGIVS